MQLTNRLLHHLKMARNARRFGIRFRRRATFSPPGKLLVNGRLVHLRFPLKEGVKWDFLTVFLEDAYGLASCGIPIRAILDIGGNVGFFSVAAKHRLNCDITNGLGRIRLPQSETTLLP
jgi:hypothetical protein